MVACAKEKLASAKRKWSVVYGPAAAVAQTCARLGWTLVDAAKMVTDDGETLNLKVDPPIVVIDRCIKAVKKVAVEKSRGLVAADGGQRIRLRSFDGAYLAAPEWENQG